MEYGQLLWTTEAGGCAVIAATAMEMTAQPHMTPVSGGGGGSDNDLGWRDDENENDRQYVPYRRRR